MPLPIVHKIDYRDPWDVFCLFTHENGSIFLDSAQQRAECARYSFIATDPFLIFKNKNGTTYLNDEPQIENPFLILERELNKYTQTTIPNLPPFQGGTAGYLGYELAQHLEHLPQSQHDDMQFPDTLLGFYDIVIAFDHLEKKAWIVSTGFPYQEQTQRVQHAIHRLNTLLQKLNKTQPIPNTGIFCKKDAITSNFTPGDYRTSVKKVIDYILSGDIFEANISQRFTTQLPAGLSTQELYHRLRTINPAMFAAYLHFDDVTLLSASPERFIKLTDKHVESRPIKGTRPRGKTADVDNALAQDLSQSEKDHAENIMIVDLLRNDLSRVCKNHTVTVPQLCGLESYATVHHLVSIIQGELHPHLSTIDLLRATFPGGSITGAPKIRAMEIIAELEPTFRGPYCGSIGYIGFNGDMDTSITIRTFCIKNNTLSFQVGGAVVADSDPQHEYEETLTKARALFNALTGQSS